jgi:organic radical activating enzyme
MTTTKQDFYCSQKFWYLSVNLERRITHSCCSATPSKINFTWLEQNPGQLFNTPLLQQDRQDMLDNRPVTSCEENCWRPEQAGLVSRRTLMQSHKKTHYNINELNPEELNLVIGSNCNLTCSYCCKQYSTAWIVDIAKNGSYLDQERFNLNDQDRLILKISQNEHANSHHYKSIISEISKFDQLKRITISGGEPFLFNGSPDLVNSINFAENITVNSGLGVDHKRFRSQIEKICRKDNLIVSISAENLDKFYEFNRYGNTYGRFLTNMNELESQGFHTILASVLSNLTVFGLVQFYNKFQHKKINYSFCNDPDFLAPNVMDDTSKAILCSQIAASDVDISRDLIQAIQQDYSEIQRNSLSIYLEKFSRTRSLDLSIYPTSFLHWLGLK